MAKIKKDLQHGARVIVDWKDPNPSPGDDGSYKGPAMFLWYVDQTNQAEERECEVSLGADSPPALFPVSCVREVTDGAAPKRGKMFVVIYDDGDSLFVPMTEAIDCDGGLEAACRDESVCSFDCRADARAAIRISRAHALLRKAQGKPYNGDFVEHIKNVKIVPLRKWRT